MADENFLIVLYESLNKDDCLKEISSNYQTKQRMAFKVIMISNPRQSNSNN